MSKEDPLNIPPTPPLPDVQRVPLTVETKRPERCPQCGLAPKSELVCASCGYIFGAPR
jgi:hypothetical protein